MKRILAVIDHTEYSLTMLDEMAAMATGTGAKLIVLSLLTEEEYAEHDETMAEIERAERTSFYQNPRDAAADLGVAAIEEWDEGVSYDAIVGAVVDGDDRTAAILDVADDVDADHLALVGRRRSPAGKAIFGETAQSVILNFDGYVTTAMT